MSSSSGLMHIRKFVFCFLIYVWINSKIYLNMSELILKYLQHLSSKIMKLTETFTRRAYIVHPETSLSSK
jgi:hypothetical protein